MGIFTGDIRFLNEIEIDGQESAPPTDSEQPADYTDVTDNNPDDQNNDIGQDQGGQEDFTDQGGTDQPPTDYTKEELPEGGEAPPDEGGYPEDGGGAPPPPQQEEMKPVDDFKAKEEELYANLTPEQLDIKHRELKNQYLEMFDLTSSIVDRIGDASITEENIGVVEYITTQLSTLRQMLSDYVNDVYQTKSYMENSINYNRFLAVLNGINKMLEEVSSKKDS